MRLRFAVVFVALAIAAVAALAGCGGISVGGGNSSQPATVTIDSAAAMKAALETAGVQDIHPVNTTDGTFAAWAAVPKLKACPVLFTATTGGQYQAVKLQKPDKSQHNLEGLPAEPTALNFASWALTHASLLDQCRGDVPPAEADWPTTV